MSDDDRWFRNIVIAFAIVEFIIIVLFIVKTIHPK
jgi:hypothetical protein